MTWGSLVNGVGKSQDKPSPAALCRWKLFCGCEKDVEDHGVVHGCNLPRFVAGGRSAPLELAVAARKPQ